MPRPRNQPETCRDPCRRRAGASAVGRACNRPGKVIFRPPTFPPGFPTEIAGLPLVVSIHPRARRLSLKFCASSRTLRLTMPPDCSRRQAMQWVVQHQPWAEQLKAHRLPPPLPFRPGISLPMGDGRLLLEAGSGRRVEKAGDRLLVSGDGPLFASRVRRWLAAEAICQFEPVTRALAARIGQPLEQVTSGDWRSRWGACGRGRITYSWRLLMAPAFVQQALVAHEVAHLAHPNHGPGFWRLATELLGTSHTPARRWLRDNGPLLHSYGAEG